MRFSKLVFVLVVALSAPAFAASSSSPRDHHAEPIGAVIKNRLTKEFLYFVCNHDAENCSRFDVVIGSMIKKTKKLEIARVLSENMDFDMLNDVTHVAEDVRNARLGDSEIDIQSLFKKLWNVKNQPEGVDFTKTGQILRWALAIVGAPEALIADALRYVGEASAFSYDHVDAFLAQLKAKRAYSRLDLAQFKGKTVRVSDATFRTILESY